MTDSRLPPPSTVAVTFPALLLAASCVLPAPASAQERPEGCWSDTLTRDDLEWDVGLGVSTRNGRSPATLDIDADRVGLLGVSQGSWVAGLVAQMDHGVGFVVHVSGPAVSVLEADTYALESRLRREGWEERAADERLRLWELNARHAGRPSPGAWQDLQAAVDDVRDRAWFRREPYEPERESEWRSWYGRVLDYDPRPGLDELDIPMLWIYGAMDGQSDPSRNVRILEDYRRAGKEYTIGLYPEAGHGLLVPVDPTGKQAPRLTTAPGIFPDLIRWLRVRVDTPEEDGR